MALMDRWCTVMWYHALYNKLFNNSKKTKVASGSDFLVFEEGNYEASNNAIALLATISIENKCIL